MTTDEPSADDTAEVDATTETDTTDSTEPDEAVEEVAVEASGPGRLGRVAAQAKQRLSGNVLATALALLTAASLILLGVLFWVLWRPDEATDADAAKSAIAAASEGTVAVLSYSPDTLDHDISAAKSHLTGDFLKYYDDFTKAVVVPAAKQKSIKATAVVLRAAVSDFHADSAKVLLFVNQSTLSKERPQPSFANSSVSVTLTKAHGEWLISAFNPL